MIPRKALTPFIARREDIDSERGVKLRVLSSVGIVKRRGHTIGLVGMIIGVSTLERMRSEGGILQVNSGDLLRRQLHAKLKVSSSLQETREG